jgi:hypothetical protein
LKLEGKPVIVASNIKKGKDTLNRYVPTHSDDIKTSLLSSVKFSLAKHLSQAIEEEPVKAHSLDANN